MYSFTLIPGTVFDAEGGPPGVPYAPGKDYTSTRHGRFVIGSVGPHVSSSKWRYSIIPWGAPIRLDAKNYVEVQINGRWVHLHTLKSWRDDYLTNPDGARKELEKEYASMSSWLKRQFGMGEKEFLPGNWGGALPKYWMLNDFGQVAIKYFVDHNGNRKLDSNPKRGVKKEELLSDFLHTTSYYEMVNVLNRELHRKVTMLPGTSHGCVHMIPNVVQDWVKKGILKVGATLQIHEYAVTLVPRGFEKPEGSVGQEIHFFPGAKKIALYNVVKK